ncbi:MAG TPA: hypothetical protein VIM16_14735 [Mucilaginibacter sp.]|jgi:hypothetical protein
MDYFALPLNVPLIRDTMNENTIQDLQSLKEQLLEKIASIDAVLSLNSGLFLTPHHGSIQSAVFNSKDSYKEKIAKVLKSENRFLNITQLIDIIHAGSPKISREDVKDGVNSAKSALLKDNAIEKITVGTSNQNSFYGSPNWLEAPNTPKQEYMYDKGLIKEKKKIEI